MYPREEPGGVKVMGIRLSQEAQLLLLCARTQVNEAGVAQIQDLLREDLDWDAWIILAHRQGILPLVTGTLRQYGSAQVPSPVMEQLRQQAQGVAMRNLLLAHELTSILKTFKAAQVLALPFKGPTLALLAYGNVALRQFIDLDILVPRSQIRLAKQILVESGYHTKLILSEQEEEDYLQTQLGYDFFHPHCQISVELHWNLLQRWLSYPARVEEIWEDPQRVELLGTPVHTLAIHHLLPYLCAHATKHGWTELKWICDVAELLRRHPDLDWDRILAQAEALRSLRMLLLGLGLSRDLLGVSLPEEIDRVIQEDAKVPHLIDLAQQQLFQRSILPGSWQEHLFFLQAREQFQDRWVYLSHLGRLTLQPSSADRSWVPLPKSLEFLYLLLRPFRVLVQSISGQRIGGPNQG